jgi:LysR family transcriptional regulator of gallate degradation
MILDIPNLRHLRAFLEVAKHQRISAAAEHVHLSQPAITQAIGKLEATLGALLFDRRPNGMYISEAGRLFQARASRTLKHLQTGVREAVRFAENRQSHSVANFEHLLTAAKLRALAAMSAYKNYSIAA